MEGGKNWGGGGENLMCGLQQKNYVWKTKKPGEYPRRRGSVEKHTAETK